MFDKATLSLGTTNEISKVALMAGSSQQGKALRASVALKKEYEIWTITEWTYRTISRNNHFFLSFIHSLFQIFIFYLALGNKLGTDNKENAR